MRLTVTGAGCPLGQAVVKTLARGHKVRAVDVRLDPEPGPGIEIRTGDIRDREFASQVTRDADVVVHLAPLATAGLDDTNVVDAATRGAYNLIDTALDQGVVRFVLGSSLSLFDRLPAKWRFDENWRPRPEPIAAQLSCWLAELSVRESCRTAPARAICLRFGAIVDDRLTQGQTYDSRWLHIDDAVQAVERALLQLDTTPTEPSWELFHITHGHDARIRGDRARGEKFGYQPRHQFAEWDRSANGPVDASPGAAWRTVLARRPVQSPEAAGDEAAGADEPLRRVVIFGSGGPVAASLAEELQEQYVLRQTDLRTLAQIRSENKPQSEGAPLPVLLPPPHEDRAVDIRDAEQVLDACRGMDVAVNCTVVRPDPVEAFRVNTLGAYNLMRAAVVCGIRRVVQTGPQLLTMDGRTGYWWDYDVPGNAPSRPGRNLYAHSKFLGQEICRVFAENYEIEIPVLVYAQFLNPKVTPTVWTMAVSWRDSARALRRAIEVETLPSPYEEMVITNDLPVGRFSAGRAEEVLGWRAEDDLHALWEY